MIIYYSGTGNSAFAAKKLASLLDDEALDLFSRIRNFDHSALYSERPWVVVCPTYAWQIPRLLRDYLKLTELKGNQEICFVMTCGSGIGNASYHCRVLAEEKKMVYRGCAKVVMPENYIAMFNAPEADEARAIVREALPVLEGLALLIGEGESIDGSSDFMGKLNSSIVNKTFYSFSITDRPFIVSDACIGCGKCVSLCPLGNIRLYDGKPAWLGNCTHCMACICHCPESAIEYGRRSVGKPRYTCPSMDEAEKTAGE